jgi:hypothetical protein
MLLDPWKELSMKVSNEMSPVRACDATRCAYNVNQSCHAKAVTIGDLNDPGCDTFLDAPTHNKETRRIAGVGACKVSVCKFNDDLECTADTIAVGYAGTKVKCLTFAARP